MYSKYGIYPTPGEFLALKGKDEAVELFRKLGASPGPIARSYAILGNTQKMQQYSNESKDVVCYLAEGCAISGAVNQVNAYLEMPRVHHGMIAAGYASGGHIKLALDFCKKMKAPDLLNSVVFALAKTGQHSELR